MCIAISDRGGIVGRGVLLDFVRYAVKKGIEVDPLSNYGISLTQIQEMIEEEGLTIRQGDILIVRSGLSKWIRASTPESVGPWERGTYIGVDPTPELIEWVWNQNFGAVAGDATSFESIPASDKSCKHKKKTLFSSKS
jgi:kynurenine formamidase